MSSHTKKLPDENVGDAIKLFRAENPAMARIQDTISGLDAAGAKYIILVRSGESDPKSKINGTLIYKSGNLGSRFDGKVTELNNMMKE